MAQISTIIPILNGVTQTQGEMPGQQPENSSILGPFAGLTDGQTAGQKGEANALVKESGDKVQYFSSLLLKLLNRDGDESIDQFGEQTAESEIEDLLLAHDLVEGDSDDLTEDTQIAKSDYQNPFLTAVEHLLDLLIQLDKKNVQNGEARNFFEELSKQFQLNSFDNGKETIISTLDTERLEAANILKTGFEKELSGQNNLDQLGSNPEGLFKINKVKGNNNVEEDADAFVQTPAGSNFKSPLNSDLATNYKIPEEAESDLSLAGTAEQAEPEINQDPELAGSGISQDQKEYSNEQIKIASDPKNNEIENIQKAVEKPLDQDGENADSFQEAYQAKEKTSESRTEFMNSPQESGSDLKEYSDSKAGADTPNGDKGEKPKPQNFAETMVHGHRQGQESSPSAQNNLNVAHQLSSQDFISAHEDKPFKIQQENMAHDSAVVEQVSKGVLDSIILKRRRAVLQLNPPELGKVRVELIVHKNSNIHATFVADQPEAKHILETNMVQLKTQLEAQGFQLGSCSVDIGQGWGNQHQDSNFNGWNSGNGLAESLVSETETTENSEASGLQSMTGRVHIVV